MVVNGRHNAYKVAQIHDVNKLLLIVGWSYCMFVLCNK